MKPNPQDLQRAQLILKQIASEKINSNRFSDDLRNIRRLSTRLSKSYDLPDLTDHIAVTLCGFGLCGELSKRFALEYTLAYQEREIGLIYIKGNGGDNHNFVYIGKPNIPAEIEVGKGSEGREPSSKKDYTLENFISDNPHLLLVDPLISFAGSVDNLQPLLDYCSQNALTHIEGVQNYAITKGFHENTAQIKANAQHIAREIIAATPKTHLSAWSVFSRKGAGPWAPHYIFPQDVPQTPVRELTELLNLGL